MVELTVKDLKAVLDDDDLDLNMRHLEKIPVKALSKLPRATHIDLSTNCITNIPPEFCLLTHITRLDLSSNQIYSLPENFGNLSNLNHLDLYKNLIEDLPLSFGLLANLKWLDLKSNPLQNDLQKVCGDCQDEKGCKAAAYSVVRYMRRRADDQKTLLEKQNELNRRTEAASGVKHENTVQKDKKKKKKKQKENSARQQISEAAFTQGAKEILEKKANHANASNTLHPIPGVTHRSCSAKFLSFVLRFCMLLLVVLFLGLGITSYLLFNNCSNGPERWIPSSEPFCKDLRALFNDHKVSHSFWKDCLKTASSLRSLCAKRLGSVWNELAKYKLAKETEEWFYFGYSYAAGFAFLLQKYFRQAYAMVQIWYYENASGFFADAVDNLIIASKMICAIISDFMSFAIEKGTEVLYSLGSNIVYYLDHRRELLDRLQFWWENLK